MTIKIQHRCLKFHLRNKSVELFESLHCVFNRNTVILPLGKHYEVRETKQDLTQKIRHIKRIYLIHWKHLTLIDKVRSHGIRMKRTIMKFLIVTFKITLFNIVQHNQSTRPSLKKYFINVQNFKRSTRLQHHIPHRLI